MSKIKLSKEFIKSTVKLALNEDLYPSGDITSSLINNDKVVNVKIQALQRHPAKNTPMHADFKRA